MLEIFSKCSGKEQFGVRIKIIPIIKGEDRCKARLQRILDTLNIYAKELNKISSF